MDIKMPRRTGLGKGLDALIPGKTGEQQEDSVLSIPIERIQLNPHQPRTEMNSEELSELATSIKEHGILQPLIVSKEGEELFTLVAGERRLKAAQLAGLNTVPAIVRQVSEQEYLELALIENIQRSDLNPLEMAEAYRQLNEVFGLSHELIAQQVGKSRASVTNAIRLLKLPLIIRSALTGGHISEGHARALLALPTQEAQIAAFQTILRENLNVRKTEELVQRMFGNRDTHSFRSHSSKTPEILALEERLQNQLGTRVSLYDSKKGGRLVIHYYSEEELDSIIGQILKDF